MNRTAPFRVGSDLSETASAYGLLHFSCGGTGMGRQVARCSYWLLIVLGSVLLFAREQEFHILKIVVCVSLPVALIWACCSFFRLMLKRAAATFAEAQVALSTVAIWYPDGGTVSNLPAASQR